MESRFYPRRSPPLDPIKVSPSNARRLRCSDSAVPNRRARRPAGAAPAVPAMLFEIPPPPLAPGQVGPPHRLFMPAMDYNEDTKYVGDKATIYPIVACNVNFPFVRVGGSVQAQVLTCICARADMV